MRRQIPVHSGEWSRIPVGEKGGVTPHHADRLIRLAKLRARALRLPEEAILSRGHHCLQTKQVCGVLSVPGLTLEILPKISGAVGDDRRGLLRMLSVAYDLPLADGEEARMEREGRDILDILAMLFLRKLEQACRQGLSRGYRAKEEDLPVLRGRLNVIRQMTHRVARHDKLACRFDEFDTDVPINRLLAACVDLLQRSLNGVEARVHISGLHGRFEGVSRSDNPLLEKIRLDRTNAAFHDCVKLARFLLAARHQTTHAGAEAGFGLVFAMNDLFERYAAKLARRAFGHRATAQAGGRAVTDDGTFALRPDLVIEKSDETLIVDTKWKRLDHSDARTLGIASSDIYQMLAYGHAYARSGRPVRLALLYPATTHLPEGVLRRWRVTGSGLPLEAICLDVGSGTSSAQRLSGLLDRAPVVATAEAFA